MGRLADIDVLVVDCQAAGATPAHGDLLELGFGTCGRDGLRGEARAYWIKRQTDRPISEPVRRLIGYDEASLSDAIAPEEAWAMLRAEATPAPFPTLIHWARFEVPFLRALHGEGELPLDVICLHAVAARLFPDMPRRNIRALAGHLGFSAELLRRSAGHVAASAFIWRALVPKLEACNIHTWNDLHAWAEQPAPPRPKKRVFAFGPDRRRALPTEPGVYRFLRPNGDVLYVGKAANLRRRVSGHFVAAEKERALEMLTQASDVSFTQTSTALEAALLECDEIKRLDPPYNLQLKREERRAWFATREFEDARDAPDAEHPVGPLPSQHSLSGLAALHRLARGEAPSRELRADALGVPPAFAPDQAAFDRVFARMGLWPDVLAAAKAAWPLKEDRAEDEPDGWTDERIQRALTRSLVGGGLLVRRARWLCVLAAAQIRFREAGSDDFVELSGGSSARSLVQRKSEFDAVRYDRLRVLSTELRRVVQEGGDVAVTLFGHSIDVTRTYVDL